MKIDLSDDQFRSAVNDATRDYKKLPKHREYALDEPAKRSLGALRIAFDCVRDETSDKDTESYTFAKFLADYSAIEQSMLQQPAVAPPPKIEPWKSPDGTTARNPWSEPVDLKSQAAIRERDPGLADWLEKTKDGVTYQHLAERQDAEARALAASSAIYGEAEHSLNVYRQKNLGEVAKFEAAHPELIDMYRREASTPVRFSWSDASKNMTTIGKLSWHPRLAKVAAKAAEVERALATAKLARAKAAEEKARRELEAAEAESLKTTTRTALLAFR